MPKNYVYLIIGRSTGFVKIGISSSPRRRIKDLTRQPTLLPRAHDFAIIAAFRADVKHEKILHDKFADQRVRGEWFNLSDNEIYYIVYEYFGDNYAKLDEEKAWETRRRIRQMSDRLSYYDEPGEWIDAAVEGFGVGI